MICDNVLVFKSGGLEHDDYVNEQLELTNRMRGSIFIVTAGIAIPFGRRQRRYLFPASQLD